VGFRVALSGVLQPFADQPDLTFGFGGGVGVVLPHVTPSPSFSVTGHYFLAGRATAYGVGADISRVSLRTQLAVDLVHGFWFDLAVAAAPGADIVFVHPSAAVPTIPPPADLSVASPILGARLILRARLGEGTDLEVAGLLDGDLAPFRYVAATPWRRPEPVSTPYRVRPGIALGLAFDVLGRPKASLRVASCQGPGVCRGLCDAIRSGAVHTSQAPGPDPTCPPNSGPP
jgi:hypothetical protein